MSSRKRSSVGIVHRLRHHELRARRLLLAQALDLPLVVERCRLRAGRQDERVPAPSGLPPGIDAVVQPRRELQDADRIEIVDRRGVGKVAHLGRVAGDDDEVPEAEIVRAEEMCERPRAGSDRARTRAGSSRAHLALHAHGDREVAHARLRARPVGDVDDVDAALDAASSRPRSRFDGSSPTGGFTSTETTNFGRARAWPRACCAARTASAR
jgi:hypothetical protein